MQIVLERFPVRIIYWNLEVSQGSSWFDKYCAAVSSYVCICAILSFGRYSSLCIIIIMGSVHIMQSRRF